MVLKEYTGHLKQHLQSVRESVVQVAVAVVVILIRYTTTGNIGNQVSSLVRGG